MLHEIRVGPIVSSDGAENPGRSDKQGSSVVTQAHGAYAEGSTRKNIYFSYVAAVAATVPATTTLGNLIWNPPDSGVVLSMLKWTAQVQVAAGSSNFGASLCYNAQAVTPTSTPVVADAYGSTFLGAGSPSSGKAKAYKDCDCAVSQTPVMNLFHATAGLLTKSVEQVGGDFKGLWTIPPGFNVLMLAYADAVDAAGLTCTLTWEEIKI